MAITKRTSRPAHSDSDPDFERDSPYLAARAHKKRSRAPTDELDSDSASDSYVNISSAPTNRTSKKRKLGSGPLAPQSNDDEDGDDAIEELIKESIVKRNTKEGAKVVKNAKRGKGKNKLAKLVARRGVSSASTAPAAAPTSEEDTKAQIKELGAVLDAVEERVKALRASLAELD